MTVAMAVSGDEGTLDRASRPSIGSLANDYTFHTSKRSL